MQRSGVTAVSAEAAEQPRERLPEAASLLLDVMRFGLALLVLVGHTTLPFFSLGWPPLLRYADAAVPGFFVLSGFMIRYVTEDRERDPRRYFISRASRMYSVVLPALVLTLGVRVWVVHTAPAYWSLFGRVESAPAIAGHAVAHLLFLTQYWGHQVLFPPDLPLWSLGYEVPYYVLFGLLVLCRGRVRWVAAGLYALAAGPQVLFLLPLWWSGCWLYDLWQWLRRREAGRWQVGWILGATTLALGVLLVSVHGISGWARIAAAPNLLLALGVTTGRAVMPAYASGAVAWAAMLLALVLSDRVWLPKRAAWARPIRRAADGTFTLYLFHFPLLCLIVPLHGAVLRSGWATLWLDLAIVALCVAAAVPIDWLKGWMRRRLSAAFA